MTTDDTRILSIAATLRNVHGARYFGIGAFSSMTLLSDSEIETCLKNLEKEGMVKECTYDGFGWAITERGYAYMNEVPRKTAERDSTDTAK